jgi:hypothetical protein
MKRWPAELIVDVGLNHGGVDAHPTTGNDPVLHRNLHHTPVEILNHLGPDHLPEASQCLCIGYLLGADARKCSVHQIGSDFALQYRIAPVADVLEDQKPKHHLSRSLPPTPSPTVQPAACLCFENTLDQLLVVKQSIRRAHPWLPEIIHLFGQNPGPQRRLMVTSPNHRNKRRTKCFARYSADCIPKTLIGSRQFCAGK